MKKLQDAIASVKTEAATPKTFLELMNYLATQMTLADADAYEFIDDALDNVGASFKAKVIAAVVQEVEAIMAGGEG